MLKLNSRTHQCPEEMYDVDQRLRNEMARRTYKKLQCLVEHKQGNNMVK